MKFGTIARQITLGAIIAIVGASVLLGLTLYVSPTQTTNSTAQPNCPSPCIIIIKNNTYGNNNPVIIAVGTKVVWVNNDSTEHTVTAGNGAFSSIIPPGNNFSYTFDQKGTFNYYDIIHPINGVVIVGPPYNYSPSSTSSSQTIEYRAPNILIEGASLCSTNCVYPSPYLFAMIIVNATIQLSSITLYINNTFESTSQEGNNNLTSYALTFKANPNSSEMPIMAGKMYVIEFVATFSDGTVSTSTTTVRAS